MFSEVSIFVKSTLNVWICIRHEEFLKENNLHASCISAIPPLKKKKIFKNGFSERAQI
jgi:hypothetical protein